MRIIHAFAETEDKARIFMAKWDIKDGFWRLDAEEGTEWNSRTFCRKVLASPSTSWFPLPSKWGG